MIENPDTRCVLCIKQNEGKKSIFETYDSYAEMIMALARWARQQSDTQPTECDLGDILRHFCDHPNQTFQVCDVCNIRPGTFN